MKNTQNNVVNSVQKPIIEISSSEDESKDSAGTHTDNNKRKLSKVVGEHGVTSDEKLSKEKGSIPNKPAIDSNAPKNEVDPSAASKHDGVGHGAKKMTSIDLNDRQVAKDQVGEKVKGNEESPPTQGQQGLDQNQKMEPVIAMKEIVVETPPEKKKLKLGASEVDSVVVEKTEDGAVADDAKISNIDLNEIPDEIDANWW